MGVSLAGLEPLLGVVQQQRGPVVFMTGAGISAESGIPTFRGPEGYWQVGSINYRPTEMATHAAFLEMPEEVWAWYLYRRSVCRKARPNAAHLALVKLERHLDSQVVLITQNIDGLHLRAGSSPERTYQIHGNLEWMRCADECSPALHLLPELDVEWEKDRKLSFDELDQLVCPLCGERTRPHVLWFDEAYDEERFRFDSSLRAAATCGLLVVIGTSGNTNLPIQVGMLVARRGAPMIVVDPEPNPFTEFASKNPLGLYLEGKAGDVVPALCDELARALSLR